MTGKELIELAAKAYRFGDQDGNFTWTESEYPRGSKANGALWNYMGWCETAQLWNPLTDDGDALRLAVTLGFVIDRNPAGTIIYAGLWDSPKWGWVDVENGDSIAATRRAITRAAAQIGKEME